MEPDVEVRSAGDDPLEAVVSMGAMYLSWIVAGEDGEGLEASPTR